MATQIKTWQIIDGQLKPLESSMVDEGRKEQYDLESWIASNPAIIGPDLVVIGRQVVTRSGPLDLLAMDNAGNTVVIELKRDTLPREVLAQACFCQLKTGPFDHRKEGHFGHAARTLIIENKAI